MRNMLDEASSPYLLQHKDNPVHWQVWGAEALAAARARNLPILLSIGYAACHWCHVMAHESFEDPRVAEIMNAHFVCIKLDREERPDIDHIYMTALHAMGEQGGWPLTMALTPEGEAFWGGTYFPPAPRFGRPSFTQVLQALAKAWREDRPAIARSGGAITAALAASAAPAPGDPPGPAALDALRTAFLRGQDREHGGFRGAPKFPNIPVYDFLWQEYFRSGDEQAARAVHLLLRRMSMGGIYDHLGGGYARYATDEAWLVPHFEKMLYDNALILELLALAHAHEPHPLYAARARETVGWLTRDMATEGAFAASEDADSQGEEGKFYVWPRAEIAQILGLETDFFASHYPLPGHGNWEGKIILERVSGFGDEERLAPLRETLRRAREKRIRPGRDDKILADWNALAVAALARASAVFGEPGWLGLAQDVFDTILANMAGADGRIAHAMRGGHISAPGLLEDQAACLRAALALYEAAGAAPRLAQGLRILHAAERFFGDGAGSFYMSASDAADVFAPRARNLQDGPTPSGIGLMAQNYARLFHLTGDAQYRSRAEALLAAHGGRAERLSGAPGLLTAADMLENGGCVVISGDAPELLAAARAAPDPAMLVLRAETNLPPGHPAHGKTGFGATLCRAGTCALPVTTIAALRGLFRPAAR